MTLQATTFLTPQLFDKLFRQYETRCIRYAMTIVRDAEVARDMVHDSFTTLWEHRDQIEDLNIEAYIFRIVRNNCIMHRRSIQRGQELYEKIKTQERGVMDYYTHAIESCNPEELFQREVMEIYTHQMEQLPELSQQIFSANRVQGLTYKQIAEQLDIPVKKVDKEIQRVVLHLRHSLKDYLVVTIALLMGLSQ